ncbi:MAG: tRNA lysidine(34) synthetase TilS [Myxococcota bacterium]
MRPHPGRLRHRVGAAIAAGPLWERGHRVAVAVSGGRDSVALLDLLQATAGWHGGRLSVVHVDHGTRPSSADDARFVARLAEDGGLPLHLATVEAGPDASEAALRESRYAVFDALDVDRVALAHHRRDQAETVVLRLVQGAGTRGLGGMRPRRGRYVRPLLEVPVDDVARWVEHHGLAYRDDPTNVSPRYLRNRVRAEVLPLLEALRPGATGAIARAASLLAEDEAFLVGELDRRSLATDGPWPLTGVRELSAPLFRRFVRRRQPSLDKGQIDELARLVDRGYGTDLVMSGWTWIVTDGWLEVRPPAGRGG